MHKAGRNYMEMIWSHGIMTIIQLLVVRCSSGTNGCCKRFTADSLHVGPRLKQANSAYHWWPHTWWHLYCMWPLKSFVVSTGNALLVTDTYTKTGSWKNNASPSSVCQQFKYSIESVAAKRKHSKTQTATEMIPTRKTTKQTRTELARNKKSTKITQDKDKQTQVTRAKTTTKQRKNHHTQPLVRISLQASMNEAAVEIGEVLWNGWRLIGHTDLIPWLVKLSSTWWDTNGAIIQPVSVFAAKLTDW